MAKPPRRMGEINMYMKLHYDTRIKAEADRRLEIVQRQYDETMDSERLAQELKPPVPLVMRTETVRMFWATESTATKDKVHGEIEAAYEAEQKEWEAKMAVPKTPQEYHQ